MSWSPNSTHLIFDDDTSVRVVVLRGTRLRQIVDANPGYRFRDGIGPSAQFSPDGQAIVYASCEFTTGGGYLARNPRAFYKFEIVTVRVDGTGTQRRTTNRHFDHLPAWSPDGHRIAYLSAGSPHSDWGTDELRVLTAAAADAEPETLARDLGGTAPPQWAPDGTQLAVLRLGRDLQLGDTYATEEVGDMTAASDASPTRDRAQLGDAYAREMGVVIVASDGSATRAVARTVSTVSWSPDGQRLALARLQGNAVQLVTIAPDGSDVQVIRQLTDRAGLAAYVDVQHSIYNAPLLHVAWSPDGAHLLYSCDQQFCVVNLDGEIVGRTPEEFANERGRAAAAWAPDGSRIAVRAAGNPTPNGAVVLYTMAPDGSDVLVLVRGGLAMVAEHSGYQDAEVGKAACREGYVVPDPASNPGLVADCETLMALRDALAGQTLLNWGAGTPLNQWAGIQISGEPRRVTGLKFQYAQGVHWHESHRLVFGRLAPEIGNLDQLQTLDLCCNKLLGTFPPELESLQHLRELNLQLHGGARLDGCLSAGFVEQLEVAEGLRVCGQDGGA
ncbi:MAG: hypothetical protein OXP73_14830 [Chloroflexota bacterium]|nr:hypothetical protein [Chloroflexota bacterium]